MLDEQDFIKRYDAADMLSVIMAQPTQLTHHFTGLETVAWGNVHNIVVSAMGGSALAAEFVKNWLGEDLGWPIDISRGYALPPYVDEHSLVVGYSYSGTTEETITALELARSKRAKIVAMASGGELLDLAHHYKLPHGQLPNNIQGRYGVLYGVRAWAQLLDTSNGGGDLARELEGASAWLEKQVSVWAPGVPVAENAAKQIAAELLGHPVVIYGGPVLSSVAMKWKVDLNENAKNVAFWNYLPEMNHNELSGWSHPREQLFKVVELRSQLDHPQVSKRFEVMNRLLSDRFAPIQIESAGETKLQQLLWTFMLGSMVSAYLGILNKTDIGTLPLVDKLKQRLR